MATRVLPVDDRTPVLVGVGTYPATPEELDAARAGHDVDPLSVMVLSARRAVVDAAPLRADDLIARVGMVAVPEGDWANTGTAPDAPAAAVAAELGVRGAATVLAAVGVPQSTLVRVAAERIADGEIDAALIVGGEAKATAQRCAREGRTPPTSAGSGGVGESDERWEATGELMAPAEIEAGMWDPVQQYACIDHALATADGIDRATQLRNTAALWARMNEVAQANPLAWNDSPRDEAFLRGPGPDNRPLADPYAKWHSTQWSVDQGAALVLCAAGVARDLGIDEDRWVHPWVLVESSAALSLSRRAEMHRWPAMRLLGEAATEHLRAPLDEVDLVELYSCFPAAVKVQQRELGLDSDGTPTVTGGMAFAGGPFNNFTYQATAAMAQRLRVGGGGGGSGAATGLVTTVSGLLTKPGLAVWGAAPSPEGVLVGDLAEEAERATGSVASVADHVGTGTVATCTVTYAGAEPATAFVIADLTVDAETSDLESTRWVGTSTDEALIAAALAGELIGRSVAIDGDTCRPA